MKAYLKYLGQVIVATVLLSITIAFIAGAAGLVWAVCKTSFHYTSHLW